MAAASYTTDLTTIATGDLNVDAGTWNESTDAGWDTGGSMVDDQNLYYNNTECVSAQLTKDASGSGAAGPATIIYVHTGAFTIPADGAALIHHLWAAPPALNTIGNATSAGINIIAGTNLGDFEAWAISGSDFIPAPKGGWTNYAINPAIGTPDHTVGNAVTTINAIGIGVSATAQARGNPNACNAVRYGRCTSIYTLGDLGNGYATFLGYGLIDTTSTNKWSLLDPVEGGYKFQGLMSLGVTATAVDFRDANRTISIADTINVTTSFNAIEVHNASSNVEWTAISISALGTNSKGTFEAIDNATINKTSCTFTDMSTFTYLTNSTLLDSIYRRCGLITQGGATFTGCTFDKGTASTSVLSDDIDIITDCEFISDGSNHAIEITSLGDGSLAWDNELTSYDTGVTGSPVTPTSTGNEAIYVNVGSGTVTFNVSATATLPSIRSAGATVNVVAGQIDFKFTVSPSIIGYEWRLYEADATQGIIGTTELAGEETATVDNQTYTYTYSTDTSVAVQIIDDNYEEIVNYYTLINQNQDIVIQLTSEENT